MLCNLLFYYISLLFCLFFLYYYSNLKHFCYISLLLILTEFTIHVCIYKRDIWSSFSYAAHFSLLSSLFLLSLFLLLHCCCELQCKLEDKKDLVFACLAYNKNQVFNKKKIFYSVSIYFLYENIRKMKSWRSIELLLLLPRLKWVESIYKYLFFSSYCSHSLYSIWCIWKRGTKSIAHCHLIYSLTNSI